jgi:hypothetical protein
MNKKEETKALKRVNAAALELLKAEAALMEVDLPHDFLSTSPIWINTLLDNVHRLVHRVIDYKEQTSKQSEKDRLLKLKVNPELHGLSVRAWNCLWAVGLITSSRTPASNEAIRNAITAGRLDPRFGKGLRNYGRKTHTELLRWMIARTTT